MLAQQLQINARPDIKAVQKSARHQIAQIAVARFVFAQQHKVLRLVVHAMDAILHPARRDIDLAADDGLDARRLGRAVKVDHAVHHAVVGDGNGVLPQLLDALHQLIDAAGAVEQAVFRMNVQMYKCHTYSSASVRSFLILWLTVDFVVGGSCSSANSLSVASGCA